MKPSLRKGYKAAPATPTPAASTAKPVSKSAPDYEVSRTFFTLPSTIWGLVDAKRKALNMTASQYIASLVLKASK